MGSNQTVDTKCRPQKNVKFTDALADTMDYSQIKKIDEESLRQLTEGSGPSDKCICGLLSDQEDQGIKASIKRAFSSFKQGKKGKNIEKDNNVGIPLYSLGRGGRGTGQNTTKEAVKRKTPCDKCGCDDENIVLKHSFANIRITTPDVSSFCPCPSNCLPDREKFYNNIKVTIEQVEFLEVDATHSKFDVYPDKDCKMVKELPIVKRSMSSLIDDQITENN